MVPASLHPQRVFQQFLNVCVGAAGWPSCLEHELGTPEFLVRFLHRMVDCALHNWIEDSGAAAEPLDGRPDGSIG